MACELYCCLLPQFEALRICRSGFPIATVNIRRNGIHFLNQRIYISPHGGSQDFSADYVEDGQKRLGTTELD